MRKKLYIAYGSNLNLQQMSRRCPTAKFIGTGVIEDYELQFKGREYGAYATIALKEGCEVPVGVFEIGIQDEMRLDVYEGFPNHYFKQDVPVKMKDQTIKGMAYIMDLKMEFGMPSTNYYQVVHQGYQDCGLDTEILEQAVLDSTKKYYESAMDRRPKIYSVRKEEAEPNDLEEDEREEDLEEDELDETEAGFTQGQVW